MAIAVASLVSVCVVGQGEVQHFRVPGKAGETAWEPAEKATTCTAASQEVLNGQYSGLLLALALVNSL